MQTIIIFLIYFTLTSLLHYWAHYERRFRHIVKGVDTSEFKVEEALYLDGDGGLTTTQ